MLIVDTHNDALLELKEPQLGLTDETHHVSIEKMRRGGISMMTFAAFSSQPERYGSMVHMGAKGVDDFHTLLRVHRDILTQALCPEDVQNARNTGKIATMLSVEGGDVLEGDLHILRLWHRLGLRMFGLCWSRINEICACCLEQEDTGLTDFGREVVRECDRLGIIIDLSHASDRTFWQTAELSMHGPCASHSCARALCPDQNRDLTDEMLAELGRRGGYVGVNFCHDFLVGGGYPDDHLATLDDVVRHIEHMCEFAGAQCVGLGSDFDGIGRVPVGLEDCSKLPAIAEALLRRGWKEADVRGVMGENFLRYWHSVLKENGR